MQLNSNSNSDIKTLVSYLEGEDICTNIGNSSTLFKSADMIYPFTNEEFLLYPNDSLENKDVLTVTASADHIIHAVLCGAKNITSFDLNVFAKYYAALKLAMIKTYNYEEFATKINEISDIHPIYAGYTAVPNSIKKEKLKTFRIVLNDVCKYLTKQEIEFWYTFITMFETKRIYNDVFNNTSLDFEDMVYSNKKTYNQLRNNISCYNINYIDCDISSLVDLLYGHYYDVIYISNILSWVNKGNKNMILEKLKNILSYDGKIYDYRFKDEKDVIPSGYIVNTRKIISGEESLCIYTKK